jgi:hypothetical protein
MSVQKLDRWTNENRVPQRLLLSGSGDLLKLALSTASKIIDEPLEKITQGINQDVKISVDDEQSLKIGDHQNPESLSVRGLIKWLHQTPVSKRRVLVLENLERTSRDAMHTWLKILEEPPARAQFILTTKNHHQLPTTILSRLTVLPIAHVFAGENHTQAAEFLASKDLIDQFVIIDALEKTHKEDPKTTKRFMDELLQSARQNPEHQRLIPALFDAYTDIQRNINRRLVLEHLAIYMQNR